MRKFWFFDLDGTLADTERDIREAWKATLADLGLSCPNFDRDFVAGPPIEDMARTLLPGVYTDEIGRALRSGFGGHYDRDGFVNTFEYPGVHARVDALKAAGAKVHIVTNKRFAGATLMARKFGWDRQFDGIWAGDMYADDPAVGKLKKPQLLAKLLRDLELDAADCVMVGDTAGDVEAAHSNGIFAIGVTWGYAKPGELDSADRLAETAAEIAD